MLQKGSLLRSNACFGLQAGESRWSFFGGEKYVISLFNYLLFLPGFLPMEQLEGREPKTTIRGPTGFSSRPPSSWRKMSCCTS